ncbi:TPA: alpha-galactosidase [Streptococcus pneumoniae]
MGVRIENNLFYVESKNLSLIIENRNGYLLLKHLGKTIKNYKGSNSVYERDHAFSGNPTATNRTFSLDTQRQIFGQHGLGDFRKPTIQVQHSVTEVTDFRFVEAKILKGQNGPQGLPSPHSMDDTETLVLSWKLAPEEYFETPVALVTHSDQGLTGISHESQNFVLKHIMLSEFSKKERPILINNWEATYFDFQREKLLELADEAKKVGIELFVLDDGWFGNRFDDNRALGDWVVNEEKLGGSLESLISAIHERGLQFGLWLEPEMISVDSDLYRQHPDWAIQVPDYEHTYSRNQLVLNLANPQVVEYLKSVLDQLLSYHEIDYIKWDMNRNITKLGNGLTYLETQMQSHQYMLGLYELVSYLTEKHSHILFESCSGGGGRNDLGMIRYFPQVWASDNTDAIARLPIQYGSSYLYPTISMGAHVSAVPNHQMGRMTPLETRGHVAMMGNLGYELDLTNLSDEEKATIANQVNLYKELRPVVQLGQQYRLINPDTASNEAAVQFNYGNQTIVTYVRVLSVVETMETTLKLKDLDEEGLYKLQENGEVYSGAELMYAGLTVILSQGDFLSRQYIFRKL